MHLYTDVTRVRMGPSSCLNGIHSFFYVTVSFNSTLNTEQNINSLADNTKI